MPYDKIIDSAKLDDGMTATAKAIRAKTGKTDKIAWDESRGFASAVEAMTGSQVATGTIATQGDTFNPITVSGLGFKPGNIYIYYSDDNMSFEVGDCVMSLRTKTENGVTYTTTYLVNHRYSEEWDEESGESYEYIEAAIEVYESNSSSPTTEGMTVYPTADGFTIHASEDGYKYLAQNTRYSYIAF